MNITLILKPCGVQCMTVTLQVLQALDMATSHVKVVDVLKVR